MSATTILHVTAVLALFQYAAHAFLFTTAKPKHGPEEISIVAAMKFGHFKFGVRAKSYWDMYFGYGLLAVLTGIAEVAFLWLIASLAASDAPGVRPLIGVLLAFNVVHAGLVWKYFSFPAPVVFDVLIAACLAWALVMI